MVSSTNITVMQTYSVSPPLRSTINTTLPLTYLDIPWLLLSPTQPLFFYELQTTTAHFTRTILPNLKQSLSLTLQHFFPLAGKLVTPPPNISEPFFQYNENDSTPIIIAEASGDDFKKFSDNHQKIARNLHFLVPALKGVVFKNPLLAIQITIFPESGICLGFNLRNVVADGRTFDNFLKTWASITRNGKLSDIEQLAYNDRSIIKDPSGFRSILLKQWWEVQNSQKDSLNVINHSISYDIVRATFLLGQPRMEVIKKWILDGSNKLFGSTNLLLSPYVLACAFLWTCWIKTHWPTTEECKDTIHYFGFIAGGITRLDYPVPVNYVGNCVSFGLSKASKNYLLGENGILHSAKAIGETIKNLNDDVVGGAKSWIPEWTEMRESELHLTIIGSPKVGTYGLDFGWGKPVKVEEVSIDITRAISLCESREVVGGMEIGLALPKTKMEVFSKLFNKGFC